MKIIVISENLKTALSNCGRATTTSGSLPVLGNLLLKANNGVLECSATNLEISIMQTTRAKVEQEGVVCVSAKLLGDVITNLPTETVALETETDGLHITSGKFKSRLLLSSPEDYPVIGTVRDGRKYTIKASDFFAGVEKTGFAASVNETQPELCGVYLKFYGSQGLCAATDRYRLAEFKFSTVMASDGDADVILPGKAANELLRLKQQLGDEVSCVVAESQAVFSLGNARLTTRLVDGQFPEYEAILPKDFSVRIRIDRQQFLTAVRAVAVFAKSQGGVKLAYGSAGVSLAARTQDAGESEVEVEADVSGGTGEMLLNHRYLADALLTMPGPTVEIKLNDPTTPLVILDPGLASYTYLVMPIKV